MRVDLLKLMHEVHRKKHDVKFKFVKHFDIRLRYPYHTAIYHNIHIRYQKLNLFKTI